MIACPSLGSRWSPDWSGNFFATDDCAVGCVAVSCQFDEQLVVKWEQVAEHHSFRFGHAVQSPRHALTHVEPFSCTTKDFPVECTMSMKFIWCLHWHWASVAVVPSSERMRCLVDFACTVVLSLCILGCTSPSPACERKEEKTEHDNTITFHHKDKSRRILCHEESNRRTQHFLLL